MSVQFRKDAEPIAEEIIRKIAYHLRNNMGIWPREDHLIEIKREIKSIIVQNMTNKDNKN